MVRVRLKRTGTRNAHCFRVVVMDQRSSRDGKGIEEACEVHGVDCDELIEKLNEHLAIKKA